MRAGEMIDRSISSLKILMIIIYLESLNNRDTIIIKIYKLDFLSEIQAY